MVQNIFTICKKVATVGSSMTFDFSEEVSNITNQGWVIKQVFQNTLTLNGHSYISVTFLAEKSE